MHIHFLVNNNKMSNYKHKQNNNNMALIRNFCYKIYGHKFIQHQVQIYNKYFHFYGKNIIDSIC